MSSIAKKRPLPIGKIILISCIALTTAAGIILAQFAPITAFDWQGLFRGRDLRAVLLEGAGKKLDHAYQVLVMGVDRVPDAAPGSPEIFNGRSDTILLVRFDPRGKDSVLRILSIPRDTQVAIAGNGITKVNAANVYGGVNLAKQTVSDFLDGVRIDRYVRVDTQGFVGLVEAIGGIEVDVPKRMKYQDKTQKLNIDLYPGKQTLNGKQAEGLVRFRNDGEGDIGRVKRQQLLINGIKAKFNNPLVWLRSPQIIASMRQYIDTDLSNDEMWGLASFALPLQSKQVQIKTLPGRPSGAYEFNASYWIVEPGDVDSAVRGKFDLK